MTTSAVTPPPRRPSPTRVTPLDGFQWVNEREINTSTSQTDRQQKKKKHEVCFLENVHPRLADRYASDFRTADAAISYRRVASSTSDRQKNWDKWCDYVKPFWHDPYLHHADFDTIIKSVTGFGGRARKVHLG